MGLATMVVRGALGRGAAGLIWTSIGSPLYERIRGDNMVVETGYVNPKALSIDKQKNAAGKVETTLTYKSGDETLSLPCTKGAAGGALCGTVEYLWQNIAEEKKKVLVEGGWAILSNETRYNLVTRDLQQLYGVNKGGAK